MQSNRLNTDKHSMYLLLVRVAAMFVFLSLVGLQIFVLYYHNPAFSTGLRIVAIAILLGLTYFGGVIHGFLEQALIKNTAKIIDRDENNS